MLLRSLLLVLIGTLLLPDVALASKDKSSLKWLMANKRVTVEATSKGGASSECLNLRIKNNTDCDYNVDVTTGMLFKPSDTSLKMQPLIVWGGQKIAMYAHMDTVITVFAFCGNKPYSCPRATTPYSYKGLVDSNIIKTLTFCREKKMDGYLTQTAVWFFRNNTGISSIFSWNVPEQSEELGKFVATLAKVTPARYYHYTPIIEHPAPGLPIADPKLTKIVVPVKWKHGDYKQMYVTIYKANGDIYKRIEGGRVINSRGVSCPVEFRQCCDLNGTYKVVAADNNLRVWYEQEVVVDFE